MFLPTPIASPYVSRGTTAPPQLARKLHERRGNATARRLPRVASNTNGEPGSALLLRAPPQPFLRQERANEGESFTNASSPAEKGGSPSRGRAAPVITDSSSPLDAKVRAAPGPVRTSDRLYAVASAVRPCRFSFWTWVAGTLVLSTAPQGHRRPSRRVRPGRAAPARPPRRGHGDMGLRELVLRAGDAAAPVPHRDSPRARGAARTRRFLRPLGRHAPSARCRSRRSPSPSCFAPRGATQGEARVARELAAATAFAGVAFFAFVTRRCGDLPP